MSQISELNIHSEEVFDIVRTKVISQSGAYLRHGQLALEIANKIILSPVTEPDNDIELDNWLTKQVERETESFVEDLWHFTFAYSYSLCQDPALIW